MLSIGAPASCPMQSPSPCGSLRVFSRQPRRLLSRSAPPPLSTTFKTTSRAATKTCTFRVSRRSLDNPSPTYYFAPVIKHGGLTWRHRALRRIESGHRLACGSRLKRGPRGFVAVPNLYLHTHGPRQLRNADPVEQSRAQCASGQLFIGTNCDPMTRWIDLQHVKRGRRAHAETLPLPHGKAENPLVPPDNLAARRNQFACRLRHLLALLLEIRGQKLLVIPAGDEANLRFGPGCQHPGTGADSGEDAGAGNADRGSEAGSGRRGPSAGCAIGQARGGGAGAAGDGGAGGSDPAYRDVARIWGCRGPTRSMIRS